MGKIRPRLNVSIWDRVEQGEQTGMTFSVEEEQNSNSLWEFPSVSTMTLVIRSKLICKWIQTMSYKTYYITISNKGCTPQMNM